MIAQEVANLNKNRDFFDKFVKEAVTFSVKKEKRLKF
jgi:hypothetical protein